MSKNEIKPVAWVERNENGYDRMWSYSLESWANRPANPDPLYDQSAIDRLTADLKYANMAADAEADLADERGREIKRLKAERDAAVADAERRLQLIRDTLANTEWRHGAHNIHRELKAEVRSADAARSLDDSPMARMAAALREKAAVERSQYDKRVQSGEWGPMPELGAEAVFCVACDGAGWDGDSRERTCQSCAGSGLAARSEGGV